MFLRRLVVEKPHCVVAVCVGEPAVSFYVFEPSVFLTVDFVISRRFGEMQLKDGQNLVWSPMRVAVSAYLVWPCSGDIAYITVRTGNPRYVRFRSLTAYFV